MHVSVHYHIMHYHYLKLNSDKKKKLKKKSYKFIFGCGFLSCDSDYEKIDSVLSAYA